MKIQQQRRRKKGERFGDFNKALILKLIFWGGDWVKNYLNRHITYHLFTLFILQI